MSLSALLHQIRTHPLGRRRQLGTLLDFATWQIRSRLARKRLVYDWIGGAKILVGRGDSGFTFNIYTGLFDYPEAAFLLHALRPGDLFVDVGANIGSYTLLASAVKRARTICFEPVPETFSHLQQNLNLNDLASLVEAHNCGVGEKPSFLRFSRDENSCNHVLGPADQEPAVEVEVVTLDTALAGRAPALIKIDVEGFELAVLRGAEKTLQSPELHSIIVELNGLGPRYGFQDADVIALLKSHGFAPTDYDPFTRKLIPRAKLEENVIFVRNPAEVEARLQTAKTFRVKNLSL